MKKILIVDDQTLNQTLLASYLRQYGEQHDVAMDIRFADNGLEAVSRCEEEPFDLIFMDLIMPLMNGIEATQKISAILPHAMIIIVSTEDDETNQIQALRSGAKDYCVKPIQPDVFKHRLQLYLNMLNQAKGISSVKQSTNLFSNTVFCYKTIYQIENEEDLTQLWESLLFKTKNSVRTNQMSDLIRFMYQLGIAMLSRQVQPQIVMEEDENSYFFSVVNVHIIPSAKITQLISNCLKHPVYRLKPNLLSFAMPKESMPKYVDTPLSDETPSETNSAQPAIDTTYRKNAETLYLFDFMELDDRNSLELMLNELSTQFMWMGNNELTLNDVDQIISAFERSSRILLFYSETQPLGIALRDLTDIIQKDEAVFISMAAQMSMLCRTFNNDLILWFKSVFYEGAPSVNYMDASIISNIQMIRSFLKPAEEISLDDADGLEFF